MINAVNGINDYNLFYTYNILIYVLHSFFRWLSDKYKLKKTQPTKKPLVFVKI